MGHCGGLEGFALAYYYTGWEEFVVGEEKMGYSEELNGGTHSEA